MLTITNKGKTMIGVVEEENFDLDYVAFISFVYDDRKVYEDIIHVILQNSHYVKAQVLVFSANFASTL